MPAKRRETGAVVSCPCMYAYPLALLRDTAASCSTLGRKSTRAHALPLFFAIIHQPLPNHWEKKGEKNESNRCRGGLGANNVRGATKGSPPRPFGPGRGPLGGGCQEEQAKVPGALRMSQLLLALPFFLNFFFAGEGGVAWVVLEVKVMPTFYSDSHFTLTCLQVLATPLTRLRFWRICLDEAQMVESSTAKAAEMALKLRTRHRWCISGTPISRQGMGKWGEGGRIRLPPAAAASAFPACFLFSVVGGQGFGPSVPLLWGRAA